MSPDNPVFFVVFRLLMLLLVLWGSMQDLTTVFSFADLTMALLALFNLAALALLMKVGFRLMQDYDSQWRAGRVPVFDPDRSEEHTSELQSRGQLVCRLLLEKK